MKASGRLGEARLLDTWAETVALDPVLPNLLREVEGGFYDSSRNIEMDR